MREQERIRMAQEDNPDLTLPKRTAWLIILAMVSATIGGAVPQGILPLLLRIAEANPWRHSLVGRFGIVLLMVVTAGICRKQLDYYYKSGGARKAGVFQTAKAYSDIEYTMDWVLALVGAGLWPIAWYYTPAWLGTFSLYCLVGLYRCKYVLLRPYIVAKAKLPDRTGFLNSYPGRALPLNPSSQEIQANLDEVGASPETLHGPERIPVKYIFAGWVWSFRIHAAVSAIGFLGAAVLSALGRETLSVLFTLAWVVLVVGLFLGLSSRSLSWGEGNATRLKTQLEHRQVDPTEVVLIAILLVATIMLVCTKC